MGGLLRLILLLLKGACAVRLYRVHPHHARPRRNRPHNPGRHSKKRTSRGMPRGRETTAAVIARLSRNRFDGMIRARPKVEIRRSNAIQ
jgi:hypothetical protein